MRGTSRARSKAVISPNSKIINEAIPGMKAADIKAALKSLFAGEGMLAHFFPDK